MWNNFQKVLEKRVQGGQIFRRDKYFIKKVVEDVLNDCFGKIGRENICFDSFQKKTLFLTCAKSVWKSEVKLREIFLLEQINKKIKEKKAFLKIFFKK